MSDVTPAGYSADTEVLTRRGWLTFDQLTDDDEVATRSPDGRFEWQQPTERYSFPYDGEMVEFVSKSIDLLVTPTHQMIVRKPTYYMQRHPGAAGADWHFRPVDYFMANPGSWWEFPATSRWQGGDSPVDFTLAGVDADRAHPAWDHATEWLAARLPGEWNPSGPLEAERVAARISDTAYRAARRNLGVISRRCGSTRNGTSWWETSRPMRVHVPESGAYNGSRDVRMPMATFCVFLGLFLAEGWVRQDRDHIVISQAPASRHLPQIREILKDTGLTWCYQPAGRKFEASSKTLATWLRDNTGRWAWGKRLPDDFRDLSAPLLNDLLRGMMIGDGHLGPRGQRYYTTTSVRLADDVQEIFQKLGADAWIRPADMEAKYEGRFGYGFNNHQIYVVRERMQDSHMLPKAKMRDYHGVICRVTVPNGVIYVRRGGRPAWCAA